MEKLMTGLGALLIVVVTVFGIVCIRGTILYCIYPHIHALFPSAAKNGIIPYTLEWWDSVCIVWIFNILIKSSNTNNNSKN